MSITIRTVSAGETAQAAAALCELWPKYQAEVVTQVDELLRPQWLPPDRPVGRRSPIAVCALGYRIQYSPGWASRCTVDIATLPEWRGKGFAAELMAWVEAEAKRLGCSAVHLDSGWRGPAARIGCTCSAAIRSPATTSSSA
jgi:GNAT superfamily N-acetyltransferase